MPFANSEAYASESDALPPS